jgi:phosphatidylserine/phosphatidylglycerophosphate/cardiolipin synthase-like enzyme
MPVSTIMGTALASSLLSALDSDCAAAAALARAMSKMPAGPIDLRIIHDHTAGAVQRAAEDFSRRGWLTVSNSRWEIGPNRLPNGLAYFLEGAAAMRSILPDDGHAIAVVTMPPSPSTIGTALPATGLSHTALVATNEAFERVADSAITSLTVMTPFLNDDGLIVALNLFRRTRASRRCLVIRRSGGARASVFRAWNDVIHLGVSVLDYTLPTSGGYETFHAKVVLADQDMAYVGSANMTAFARHSMELGVLVDGRAARVIASSVRAIERIAIPLPTPSRAGKQ